MQYVNVGATGMRVSRVCLGMMSFGNDSDRPWVLDEDAASCGSFPMRRERREL